jgi:hypothetical protein
MKIAKAAAVRYLVEFKGVAQTPMIAVGPIDLKTCAIGLMRSGTMADFYTRQGRNFDVK